MPFPVIAIESQKTRIACMMDEMKTPSHRVPTIFDVLYAAAILRDGNDITPCSGRTWPECLTREVTGLILWYNVGQDTHNITLPLPDRRKADRVIGPAFERLQKPNPRSNQWNSLI